jgi:hypothetical protein
LLYNSMMILGAASSFLITPASAKHAHHTCFAKGVKEGCKNNPIDQSQIDNRCYLNGLCKDVYP